MNLDFKPLPYKKVDGIHKPEEKLNKWQKLALHFGEFLAKASCGRWEFKFKIKF